MCMMDYCDDSAIVIASRSIRARLKGHKCSECCRPIKVGEVYLYERTVYDGDTLSHEICAHCQEVRDWLMDQCHGWTYGGLLEDMYEHWSYGGFWRLLAVGMSERWTRASGELWPVPRVREAVQRLKATAAGGGEG